MILSFYANARDNIPKPLDGITSLAGLAARYAEHAELPWLHEDAIDLEDLARRYGDSAVKNQKNGPAWTPSEYAPGATRGKAGVVAVHLLVFDLDKVTPEQAEECLGAMLDRELELWVYSSYQHTPEAPRLRPVLALSRPVLASEWGAFWDAASRELAPLTDPTRRDVSSLYYLPARPRGSVEVVNFYAPGKPVDVDAMLRRRVVPTTRVEVTRPVVIVDPEPGVLTDEDRAKSRARRDLHLARVRTQRGSGAHACVRDAAFAGGREVGAGFCSADEVFEEVFAAYLERKPTKARAEEKAHTIRTSIGDGAQVPWTLDVDVTRDSTLAERFVEEHAGTLRYVPEWKKWIAWDGVRWEACVDAGAAGMRVRELERVLDIEALRLGDTDDYRVKSLRGASRRISSAKGTSELLRKVVELPAIRVGVGELDTHPWLLPCLNGVIDLRTGALLEHDSTKLITKRVAIDYDADARCDTWLRFLRSVCVDDLARVRALQRCIGYSLTGSTIEQCFFFLHGNGSNGKSTLLDVLSSILGDFAGAARAETVLRQKSAEHPTSIAAFHGKRAVTVAEIPSNRHWDEALIKSLTGSDRVTARRMHENEWTFLATHKFWFAGNHEPATGDQDEGIWRRIKLVPFLAHFSESEKDMTLPERLQAELPGILAWAVQGCLAWQAEGLGLDDGIRDATAAYRREQDYFGEFLETFEIGDGVEGSIDRAAMVQAYTLWARQHGQPELGGRAIAKRMRTVRGVGETKHEGARRWTNIKKIRQGGRMEVN